ncbi:MAG: DUF4254 domain-containing protein [Candidatus Omnitrophota bacterium]
MAETLGSLIDKLTIKDLRQYYLKNMLKPSRGKRSGGKQPKTKSFSGIILKKKLRLVGSQKKDLIEEIDNFITAAVKGKVKIREDKLKLYNAPEDMGRIPKSGSFGEIMTHLAQKNLELWHLEDEARRKDVNHAYIGKIKNKIDLANQQRNDLIDAMDELLEKCLKKNAS